ncbi:hypothetical protein OPQ81_005608 [Rhizoctonia solani]|nr:hypothetical protein OPQ81_005608 [Rhizoctonia solani]
MFSYLLTVSSPIHSSSPWNTPSRIRPCHLDSAGLRPQRHATHPLSSTPNPKGLITDQYLFDPLDRLDYGTPHESDTFSVPNGRQYVLAFLRESVIPRHSAPLARNSSISQVRKHSISSLDITCSIFKVRKLAPIILQHPLGSTGPNSTRTINSRSSSGPVGTNENIGYPGVA